jgi:hypothetical protein
MSSVCKPEESFITPVSSTIRSSDGRFVLDDVVRLINDFETTVSITPLDTTSLSRVLTEYGSEEVYQSIENLNRMLVGPAASILPNYQAINERIQTGIPITPIEYAEFVTQFLYTPSSLNRNATIDYVRVTTELNDFFVSNFSMSSMGSFCALVPGIFGVVGGFFDLLDEFRNIASKIQNISAALLFKKLKDNILNTINQVIEKMKRIVTNFSLSNIINDVSAFINESILYKITELKERILEFFSEENLKKLRDKIEGSINYALSVFKNPSFEEIQYLIYRFCKLIYQVESSINAIKNPLDAVVSNYQNAYRTISARSNINTANAVAAGAIRYDFDQRRQGVISMRIRETSAGNVPPPETEDIEGVTPWDEGRGDHRITFRDGALRDGPESWTRVDERVKVYIMKTQERFGKPLIITSAYRPYELQKRLYDEWLARGKRGGAVADPDSGNATHVNGLALDVKWNGINIQNREEFIRIARQEGFTGIGRYGTSFVHVDIGPERQWGS